jgi:hypothetical protein
MIILVSTHTHIHTHNIVSPGEQHNKYVMKVIHVDVKHNMNDLTDAVDEATHLIQLNAGE